MPLLEDRSEIKNPPILFTKSGKQLEIKLRDKIGEGAEAEIFGATIRWSKNQRSRMLNFVYRARRSEQLGNRYELENYNNAKKAGLPVPTTFRSTEDGRDLLISDLSENGINIVFSETDLLYDRKTMSSIYAENRELMDNFANAVPMDSELEKEIIQKLAMKAANADLLIPTDAWFAVIKPDGSYNFIIGDLGYLSKNESGNWQQVLREQNISNLNRVSEVFRAVQIFGKDPTKAQEIFDRIKKENAPWLEVEMPKY